MRGAVMRGAVIPCSLDFKLFSTTVRRLGIQTIVSNEPVDIVAKRLDIAVFVGQPPESTLVGRLLGRGIRCGTNGRSSIGRGAS
jgi:DNA-binding transcriptional LysR family regulator